MNNYYVYLYLREDGTAYYVGKGKGKRAWKKNKRDIIKVPVDHSRIVILYSDLTDEQALSIEKQLILEYGRKHIGTGILRNLTEGGEGRAGYKWTEEQLDKLRGENNPMYGRTGELNHNYGKKRPDHAKLMSGDNNPMRRPEIADTLSRLRRGDKNPGFKGYYVSPDGQKFDSSRKAAIYAGGVDKKTLIKWAKNNKNGWSFIAKYNTIQEN